MVKKKTLSIPRLFWDFFKFGLFTFGGGWSIIAQMQELYVEKEKTITDEDLLDLTSVGRSLPGTMIGNIAMLYGYRMAGYVGGAVCLFGMILPPFLILIAIAGFYQVVKTNIWVMAAMMGVRCAVVPIIAVAAWKMVNGAFKYPPCYAVTVLVAVLYLFLNVNCVYLVIIGGIAGWLISSFYEKKGLKETEKPTEIKALNSDEMKTADAARMEKPDAEGRK